MLVGRGDDRGVDLADQLAVVGNGPRLALGGRGIAARGDGIGHRDELDVVEAGGDAGVDAAQVAGTDHGNTQRRHAALLASRPRPWRPSCCPSMNASS